MLNRGIGIAIVIPFNFTKWIEKIFRKEDTVNENDCNDSNHEPYRDMRDRY